MTVSPLLDIFSGKGEIVILRYMSIKPYVKGYCSQLISYAATFFIYVKWLIPADTLYRL